MHPAPLPLTRDLLLVGGGHAHALVLRMWGMNPLPGVRVSVINPAPTAPYSGMLPGHIAGHYPRAALEIDLVRLARFAGARLIAGAATGLELAARQVMVPGRAPLGYDVVSIDIGITAVMPALPGFAEHAVGAKPLDTYVAAWERFLARLREGAAPAQVAVIGAGVAGVELALAMGHRMAAQGTPGAVSVIEAATPLPGLGAGARASLLAALDRAGVALHAGVAAAGVSAEGVQLADGRTVPAAFVVGAGGARPHGWLAATGLPLSEGYVTVGETLQVPGHPEVFATGDCAHMAHAPRVKAGVFAVRQAPVLLANLRAALAGGRMRPYWPQRDYLKLITTGGRRAVADKAGMRAGGPWLWRLKDRIDRRFMAKFHHLPAMPAAALPAEMALGVAEALADAPPLCGGCGAKVARAGLVAALGGLGAGAGRRADVLSGPGDDAAVLAHGAGGVQVITTDHLRAFCEDPWLVARVAAEHALGDVRAMGAAPQVALAAIILPRMSTALQARTLAEIMEAAGTVFAAAGAEIVGGHTALGAELTVGFTITGLAAAVVGKGGARVGDALIVTKPLGTGVVLAAEMQAAAEGADVLAAWGAMAAGQPGAAALAAAAHALTDVTGFGLAGHLLEMLDASKGVAAEIALDAVPLLAGAEALAAAGHRAFVTPENRAGAAARMALPEGPRAGLLFDPQTGGGLLAAVPEAAAEAVLAALHAAGAPEAARIGKVVAATPGAPAITVR